MRITRIGGPTVLIEWNGWRILTDPTFDPPAGRTRCVRGEIAEGHRSGGSLDELGEWTSRWSATTTTPTTWTMPAARPSGEPRPW